MYSSVHYSFTRKETMRSFWYGRINKRKMLDPRPGSDLSQRRQIETISFSGLFFFRQSFLISHGIETRTCRHSVQNTDKTKFFTLNASKVCVDKRSTGKLYVGSYGSKLSYLYAWICPELVVHFGTIHQQTNVCIARAPVGTQECLCQPCFVNTK